MEFVYEDNIASYDSFEELGVTTAYPKFKFIMKVYALPNQDNNKVCIYAIELEANGCFYTCGSQNFESEGIYFVKSNIIDKELATSIYNIMCEAKQLDIIEKQLANTFFEDYAEEFYDLIKEDLQKIINNQRS